VGAVTPHLLRRHLPWFLRVENACLQCARAYASPRDRDFHNSLFPSHAVATIVGLEQPWAQLVRRFLNTLTQVLG
jgi:hypothetical protein